MKVAYIICISLISSLLASGEEVKTMIPEVIKEIPRKHKGFTQGLFILEGKLYESTGLYGKSKVRRIDLATQKLELSKDLPANIFAEDLTPLADGRMVQITWQAKTGIVYDREHINISSIFQYETEGWGIASAGEQLVMSDGSDKLTFLDSKSFEVLRVQSVTKNGKPVEKLNELEWVGDHLYANVWMSDKIVKIAPKTGKVVASIDCSALLPQRPRNQDAVLNGIAYDSQTQSFYLTGKLWPAFFQVRFVEKLEN